MFIVDEASNDKYHRIHDSEIKKKNEKKEEFRQNLQFHNEIESGELNEAST